MSEKEPILRVQNLCKDFKLRGNRILEPPKVLHALSGVSLDLYAGETLGVIGESGCGKSTLGRCIVRLHQPTSGSLLYRGEDILHPDAEKNKKLHKEIQMIFQDPYSSLDPRVTAGRAVEEPLLIHGMEKDRKKRREMVLNIMREVGLDTQHMNRYPHEFSGGQRQRLNVARALIMDPKIIVCDEPVSALDVSIQAQVLNLLNSLQKQRGLTYLFISHDLSVIKHISDRIVIMYLGRVVELCSSVEIYRHPLHPYTKALLSAIPPDSPDEKAEELELKGDITSPVGEMKGCPLAPRCPYRTERCSVSIPELKEAEPGHQVACFLYHGEEEASAG